MIHSTISKITGIIKVEEKNNKIYLYGIDIIDLVLVIKNTWGTSVIGKNIFEKSGFNEVCFYSFFAPEIVFIFNKMIAERPLGINIRKLKSCVSGILDNTWMKKISAILPDRLDISKIEDFIYPPLPYQLDFINYYNKVLSKYDLKGSLLNAAAGTGKTYTTLVVSHCLNAERVIVVCPNNALDRVWVANVNTLFKTKQTYWTSTSIEPYNNQRFIIVHYESLEKIMHLVDELSQYKVAIILDESHNFNGLKSLRTNIFIDLCSRTKSNNVILASGTPIKALGSEIIPLLRVIDDKFTIEVEDIFKKMFGLSSIKAEDILRHRLGIVSFLVLKEELNLNKPIIHDIGITIANGNDYTLESISIDMQNFVIEKTKYYEDNFEEISKSFYSILKLHEDNIITTSDKEEFEIYKSNLKSIIYEYKHGSLRNIPEKIIQSNLYEKNKIIPGLSSADKVLFKNNKAIVKYVKLKIQGECLGKIIGRARINCNRDMVVGIDFDMILNSTVKKTVVFSTYTEVCEAAKNALLKLGYTPVTVYGSNTKELSASVGKFDKQESINPLVATYASLSTAVPLIMADTMLMIDSPFRAYIEEQAISRIYRLGSDTQTVVFRSFLDTGTKPNITTRSIDILNWSKSQIESITGVKSPIEGNDLDLNVSTEELEYFNLVNSKPDVVQSKPMYSKW